MFEWKNRLNTALYTSLLTGRHPIVGYISVKSTVAAYTQVILYKSILLSMVLTYSHKNREYNIKCVGNLSHFGELEMMLKSLLIYAFNN